MDPETLRKDGEKAVAQYKALDGFPGTGYIGRLGQQMIAAADAWEKQLADATASNHEIASAHWALCKRLEEAEKLAEQRLADLNLHTDNRWTQMELDAAKWCAHELRAALAKEEK